MDVAQIKLYPINPKSSLYYNMSQNILIDRNENIKNQQKSSSQWAEITGQVVEKLTGTNMSTTISFNDFEVDVPKAQGPGGRDLGGAKWTINGKIVWTTQAQKTIGG